MKIRGVTWVGADNHYQKVFYVWAIFDQRCFSIFWISSSPLIHGCQFWLIIFDYCQLQADFCEENLDVCGHWGKISQKIKQIGPKMN